MYVYIRISNVDNSTHPVPFFFAVSPLPRMIEPVSPVPYITWQAFAGRGPEGEAAGVAAVASAGGVAGVLYTTAIHPVSDHRQGR